ncbi:serine/threonine-protein kinase mTOR-like [Ornithodoros turicata]|uniref:serine/threonine-protein kinase mTOR-like n=1 Tax=Ornithodoros turicata TaxID=34597 RepID=UPI003139714D
MEKLRSLRSQQRKTSKELRQEVLQKQLEAIVSDSKVVTVENIRGAMVKSLMIAQVNHFVAGLKSRNEDTRLKAAKELHHYVTTELREMGPEDVSAFMDEFNGHIFEMVSSSDVSEKKGGILAIVQLVGVESRGTRGPSRFANYLRILLPSSDTGVMELAAYAMGRLTLASSSFTAEYVNFSVKRAIEWLKEERNEAKRHAAVLVLQEMATSAPTLFFQNVQPFFECIFTAIRDQKPAIREVAVVALRAALAIMAQRETKDTQNPPWYLKCYEEAEAGFEEIIGPKEKGINREDRVHGSLLVINELLKCGNLEGERVRQDLEELTTAQQGWSESPRPPSVGPSLAKSLRALQHMQQHQKGSSTTSRGSSVLLRTQKNPQGGLPPVFSKRSRHLLVPSHESATCRALLLKKFDQICDKVLRQRGIRNPHIQQVLHAVIPRLAAFQTDKFVKAYLPEAMSYLLGCLRRERSMAFLSIGLLAVAVGDHMQQYLPRIMEVVSASLPSNATPSKKKGLTLDPAVFTCISLLARAHKRLIVAEVKDLLEPMLNTGLSPALTAALHEISMHIPLLKKDIQDGLLKTLSCILMHKPLRHPGMPKHLHSAQQSPGTLIGLADVNDPATITLALKTLGSFDFEGRTLTPFVKHCADTYLSSEYKEVRLEAIRTCCCLLSPALENMKSTGKYSGTLMETVQIVLGKLLLAGVTDTDSDVRYCVLASLDEKFDGHLAQAENLSALFILLNDEAFEIRELALCTIGRLSNLNPAYIMPPLRKVLIQILTELEHSGVVRNKEQSAKMLGHLLSNAPRLVRPYVEPILSVLIPKLEAPDPNPGVVICVLAAIGEQAQVSGTEMRKWMDKLLPIIIDMLQDSSSLPKREISLWTLGQLVESTGYVVDPYHKYPALLDVLLNFLKVEQFPSIRREAIRVLGLLGALDPFKHKLNMGMIDDCSDSGGVVSISVVTPDNQEMGASEMLVSLGGSLEDFYPAIAVSALMRVMRDPTLSQHHTIVVTALVRIIKSLGLRCVPYIPQVVPSLLNVIRTADTSFREFLFQQLGLLIAIVKQHIRNYLDDIFLLIKEFWNVNSPIQSTIIMLVEQIVMSLGSEIKVYLPKLVPQALKVFMHDTSPDRTVTAKLLVALQKFKYNLDDYLHLVLPPVVKLFDSQDVPLQVRMTALETIDVLSESLDFSEFASRIIHPLVRTLDTTPELSSQAMDTLCALVIQLGKKYKIFIPMVAKVMEKNRISHQRYNALVTKIVRSTTLIEEEYDTFAPERRHARERIQSDNSTFLSVDTTMFKKQLVSSTNLERLWTPCKRLSKDDWLEWLRRLTIGLLKESPSPALRSCWTLAESYKQLPRDLFNAAFLSCWVYCADNDQRGLIESFQRALMDQDIPEIMQTLLNLAEFMEHCEKGPLPLDQKLLGERAMKCRAYAKALHYKEDEFHKGPTTEVLEALISINNKLQQPEAASGVLDYASKCHAADLKVKERWYEKLHDWDNALKAYQQAREQDPDDVELVLGQMRCLEVLGEWDALCHLASDKWDHVEDINKQKMARMASAAAWGLEKWETMEEYVHVIPRDTTDSAFHQAVLAVHKESFQVAQQFIDKARDLIDTDLTAMVGESYSRAYGAMVQVQMLAELEEVIQYKLVPERRDAIKQKWWDRLQGCQRIVEDWQRVLQLHSLVMKPKEDMRTWLKFASLCRRMGRLAQSHRTLVTLLGADPSQNLNQPLPTTYPAVTFAYIKHMWKSNLKEEALKQLHHFVQTELPTQNFNHICPPLAEEAQQRTEQQTLLAKCYLKLGSWEERIQGINENSIPKILHYYQLATEHDANWYKAWHAWAYMNFEAVLFYKNQVQQSSAPTQAGDAPSGSYTSDSQRSGLTGQHIRDYTVPAVKGFFRSIALSHGSTLQDTLRLLTLWFEYGQWGDVQTALCEGLRAAPVETWLQVVPQLIARLDSPRAGALVHQLLLDVGKQHPQALIYPLTVASKSTVPTRMQAASRVLRSMKEHCADLVQQAVMVSEELIRVAILWHELWHEGLEEASRLYFGERNIKGMFATLEPLHAMMERGPQTLRETSFNQAYGRDLAEAQEWCKKYQRSMNVKDLTQAWDLYYHVFRRISKQLPQLTSLELQYVSPKLLMCRDLDLAVPGSYNPSQPVISIARVESMLQVITSKQRPRKLCIKGSNGKDYMFLLKGHEDLRQDERVMQLFGLVNTLLVNDPETSRRNLTIQRYSVIPLSTNSGLIGWVPHCDTLHTLIRDYRDKKKILLNIEHRIMLRMAPDYDHLTLMQKVEVFEHALEHTNGDDLAKLLWLKSPSSEVWFDRRTNYTRSLAVMSMVGYVLGLGDRHPSNLMLDRLSGKILHIDFGDCFEVAMTREKFPEKIPFRLTRMLINAMEVTGIEGTYRMTCNKVMKVLRGNKDSLMAVLEAFVYDPLLNWRLMDSQPKVKHAKARSGSAPCSQDQGDMLDTVDIGSQPTAKKGIDSASAAGDGEAQPEALNKKALAIINRVRDKLTGRDFAPEDTLDVPEQVELLIKQATSHENLCQCYIGWCPFW